ncbi:hypothetical protein CGJ15_26160 [Vibrio parahaemolyticus]|nr:hypothetical protein CGJ15_26160 [Vibrio parahaemolyticus]
MTSHKADTGTGTVFNVLGRSWRRGELIQLAEDPQSQISLLNDVEVGVTVDSQPAEAHARLGVEPRQLFDQ